MKKLSLAISFFFLTTANAFSQPAADKLVETILEKDRAFWSAYNKCDTAAFKSLFTDDVEFYHDKGGVVTGHENFMLALKNGLCGNPDSRLRREAVKGTVNVFPLSDKNALYGAIISGEHVFYVNQKGKPEFLDGHARFMQLWIVKDGKWKMSRILSYDHGDAKRRLKLKE